MGFSIYFLIPYSHASCFHICGFHGAGCVFISYWYKTAWQHRYNVISNQSRKAWGKNSDFRLQNGGISDAICCGTSWLSRQTAFWNGIFYFCFILLSRKRSWNASPAFSCTKMSAWELQEQIHSPETFMLIWRHTVTTILIRCHTIIFKHCDMHDTVS